MPSLPEPSSAPRTKPPRDRTTDSAHSAALRRRVEAKAADQVRYLGRRWAALLHSRGGLPLADGIASVCAGAATASRTTGTKVSLIATALRSHDAADNVVLAETASRFRDRGLTGF